MSAGPFTFYNLCDYFEFLDDLRHAGSINMMAAAPYLAAEYPDLGKISARAVLTLWRHTFSDEPLEDRVHKAQVPTTPEQTK